MSDTLKHILNSNKTYVKNFGKKSKLPIPPARNVAILTCMDARLDPGKFAGLEEGDAHVIRNAGGRASDDAIRSLIISYKLLGTKLWLVIHHTNCGMETFTDNDMRNLLEKTLKPARLRGKKWVNPKTGNGSTEVKFINWLTIKNQKDSIVEDVKRIRNHPLVPGNIRIYGFLFDVATGKLIEIPAASKIGRPTKK